MPETEEEILLVKALAGIERRIEIQLNRFAGTNEVGLLQPNAVELVHLYDLLQTLRNKLREISGKRQLLNDKFGYVED